MKTIHVTKGDADLRIPPDMPADEVWRYGIGVPFQVGPRMAALSCNLRREYAPVVDFEVGTDFILFDDLSQMTARPPVRASRNHEELDPDTGKPCIMMKYPVIGGFVPWGAKRPDGSAHPHAGTGFGVSQAVPFILETQRTGKPTYSEFFQLAYDGNEFRVVSEERAPAGRLPGMTNGIPDGDDLLFAMWQQGECAGVARWRSEGGLWREVAFSPVEGTVHTAEPSLVRDVDGALLFSTRGSYDIRVWRSYDGTTWERIVEARTVRSESPMALNLAADGTPYVIGNLYQEAFDDFKGIYSLGREVLIIWPLRADRTGLEAGIPARLSRAEFGPPLGQTHWCVDHPNASTVQLADGQWHNVLSYRIVEEVETCPWCRFRGPETHDPHTGCYVEEVLTAGERIPTWNF